MEETVEETVVEAEDRVDDRAIDAFLAYGFKGRWPDALVNTYLTFKRSKDMIRPGPLSAEGYATVLQLYRLQLQFDAFAGQF